MKKSILIIFFALISGISYGASGDEDKIAIPEDITWTERFILTEIKELRVQQETYKREVFTEIHNRELETIDKALSYSANTVNFFFVAITIIIMLFGIVGWRTLHDIKTSTKENLDKETNVILKDFQKKIFDLEKEQKVNIYWRQLNISENDKEKIEILDKISEIKPDSKFVIIERSNVYLSMGLYDKVIDVLEPIVSGKSIELQDLALYNKACAYAELGNEEEVINNIKHLLQIQPAFKTTIIESEYFSSYLKKPIFKKILC